jgi:hypothetical protein
VSIISGSGTAICTAVVVARCNGRWQYCHILGVGVQTLAQLGGHADILRPFIWSRVSGLMRFHDGFDIGTASNFVQISEKVGQRPWQ